VYQVPRTLGLIWPDLLRDRIFFIGLILKLVFILLLIPEVQEKWFLSFMVQTFERPSVNPWSLYQDLGGSIFAFPYGPIMFLAHFPSTFIGWLIDSLTSLNYFSGLGFRISLLIADVSILILLLQQFENRWRGLMIHYWLSPLVIFITYWHGQTDIVPVAMLVLCITLLKNKRVLKSGLVFAGAVAAKHSMIIVLPFIAMYLWFKRGTMIGGYKFIIFSLIALIIVEGPYLFSNGFQQMVVYNREIEKIYWLFIPMSDTLKVYIIPLIYLLLLYFTWRLRRMNFDLLLATLGVAFSVVIVLTPPAPGWVLWVTPMLAIHLSRGNSRSTILGSLFSLIFIVYHLIYSTGSDVIFLKEVSMPMYLIGFFSQLHIQSLLNTIVVSFFILIILQMFRDGIKGSDYYHLGKKPLVIGVSGGLSSGKSTFVNAMSKLFGDKQVLKLSEDSYYNWRSSSPMWKTLTSLDPRSSQLSKMVSDLQNILDSKVFSGYAYNRKHKKFIYRTNQNSRQVVLLDSSFSLHSKQLVEMEDVSFFLEMGSGIGINKNIANQDVDQLKKQSVDYKTYIQPQKAQADAVFSLLPVNPEIAELKLSDSRINLKVVIKDGLHYQELIKVLTGVCGLQINIKQTDSLNIVEIDIQGDVDAEDVKFASKIITPGLHEFLDDEYGFCDGKLGLMQLIALVEIDHSLKRRKRQGIC
jgi:uridine kinase